MSEDDRMASIVTFLRARYDEDAARQRSPFEQWHHRDCEALPDLLSPDAETGACTCGVPEHVLADIAAKREVVRWHNEDEACSVCLDDVNGCPLYRALALPYAKHPEYDGEWRS
jgi:hypothetical protein